MIFFLRRFLADGLNVLLVGDFQSRLLTQVLKTASSCVSLDKRNGKIQGHLFRLMKEMEKYKVTLSD
jgi:hypothetical protein